MEKLPIRSIDVPSKPPPLPSAHPRGVTEDVLQHLPLELLDDNPHQPRLTMEDIALEELASSIRSHGLLQPISARRTGERYQVVAGHRRLAAYRLLHRRATEQGSAAESKRFGVIPVRVLASVSDEDMALLALVENLQRDDLSPAEAADALLNFQEANKLSTEQLVERTGLEPDRVKRLLRLARAPLAVKRGCTEGLRVPLMDAEGKPLLNAYGKPKLERRRLDLMAALELARVFPKLREKEGERAGKKLDQLVQRVLEYGWPLARVKKHCADILDGKEDVLDAAETAPVPAAAKVKLPFREEGQKLIVDRAKLSQLDCIARDRLIDLLAVIQEELAKMKAA